MAGELATALYTTAFTGTAFLIWEILTHLLIKQIREFNEAREKVDLTLSFYSHFYTNPLSVQDKHGNETNGRILANGEIEMYAAASDKIREAAINLMVKAKQIPSIAFKMNLVPSLEDITKAYQIIIFLSNSMFRGNPLQNEHKSIEINKLLRL